MLAPQKKRQQDFGVDTGFTRTFGRVAKIQNSLLFATTQSHHAHSGFNGPGKASHHIIVSSNDELGVSVTGRKLENTFVIASSADSIAKRREPRTLHKGGIGGKLGAS